MLVTLSGITMEARLVHQMKALFPMLVTLSGITMEARLPQPEKALFPMLVTLSGIVYDVKPYGANATKFPSTIKHLLSEDANLPLNSERLEHL